MAGIDLGAIVRDLGQLSNVQHQQTQEIASRRMQQGEIGQEIANNLFEVAERTERVERQTLGAQLEAQQGSRKVARTMGMDASASNEILTHMGDAMRTDMLAYQAASREAQALEENNNLLSNPLGWLEDVLNGDEIRARRDATAERLQNTQSQLNNMHALTQSNVQTQNAIAETMTAASIKDQARSNALLAESKALEAESNAAEYTIAGYETLREFGSQEFNRRLQVGNAVRAAQYQAQNMDMQRQQLEQRKRQIDKEMEQDQSWEYIAEVANGTIDRLGLQRRKLTPAMVKQHWGQNTPVGQQIMALADRGFLAEDTGSNIVGRTPYDTVTFADQFGASVPGNLDPDALNAIEEARGVLAQERAEAEAFVADNQRTEHGLTKNNYDDYSAQAAAFNTVVDSRIRTADTNFDEYKINTPAIKTTYPQFEQTDFYKGVVEPLETTDAGITIQTAAAQTAEKFSQGQLDINEAVEGLTALWQAQRDLFDATNGRDAVGINTYTELQVPRLLVGEKYDAGSVGVLGATPGSFTSFAKNRNMKTNEVWERIDLTDPNATTRYLINYRSNKLARQMQESANR